MLAHATRQFERDDDEYRKTRGVEAFNAAGDVMQEYKRLDPDAQTAVPHVGLCVVPRQMVALGDPGRRGTDHSEAYGAYIKDDLHRRCLRRKKALAKGSGPLAPQFHERRTGANKGRKWIQRPLAVSRIMQVFRCAAVREKLLRDEESAPYLQRQHYRTASTGFQAASDALADGPKARPASIFSKMREGVELA